MFTTGDIHCWNLKWDVPDKSLFLPSLLPITPAKSLPSSSSPIQLSPSPNSNSSHVSVTSNATQYSTPVSTSSQSSLLSPTRVHLPTHPVLPPKKPFKESSTQPTLISSGSPPTLKQNLQPRKLLFTDLSSSQSTSSKSRVPTAAFVAKLFSHPKQQPNLPIAMYSTPVPPLPPAQSHSSSLASPHDLPSPIAYIFDDGVFSTPVTPVPPLPSAQAHLSSLASPQVPPSPVAYNFDGCFNDEADEVMPKQPPVTSGASSKAATSTYVRTFKRMIQDEYPDENDPDDIPDDVSDDSDAGIHT